MRRCSPVYLRLPTQASVWAHGHMSLDMLPPLLLWVLHSAGGSPAVKRAEEGTNCSLEDSDVPSGKAS